MAFFRRILFKGESWILTPQAQQKTGDAYVAGFRFSKHFCFCRFVFCWHELWKGLVMHLILLGDLHARMVRGKRDRDSGTSVIPWEPVLALSLSLSLSFSPSRIAAQWKPVFRRESEERESVSGKRSEQTWKRKENTSDFFLLSPPPTRPIYKAKHYKR